jgi:hypothetical protein
MVLLMLFALILFGSIAGAIFYSYRVTQELHAIRHAVDGLRDRIAALENPQAAKKAKR